MLETERSYVQTLCDASPEQAVAIIETANATMLAGRSGKKAFFNWQWTTDGGKIFNNAPSTPHAKTMIANLMPLTMVGFRVSVTDVNGPGEWSQVVTVLVH